MSDKGSKILIVDDEIQIRRLLRISLEAQGYKIIEAVNGQDGLLEAAQRKPDLIILDLGLPDMEGLTVLKRLREWSRVPVIILSVKDREDEKVAALDLGADDYVTKPFGTAELLARMRVALRHSEPSAEESVFRSVDLEVDLASRVVRKKGKEVQLTATEYSLLKYLVRNAGKVLTHRQLLKEVWGPNYETQTHYLRVYITHLREKLESTPSKPKLIITESGIGYRLMSDA